MSIQDKINLVRNAREGGHVRRCHTVPHIGEYSVAAHCYHAVSMLYILHPAPSHVLVQALLWHDVAERWLGDLPSPTKRDFPELAFEYEKAERAVMAEKIEVFSLTSLEAEWLKAIDVLELLLWALDQMAMGNQHVEHFVSAIDAWFNNNQKRVPRIVWDFYRNYTFERAQ